MPIHLLRFMKLLAGLGLLWCLGMVPEGLLWAQPAAPSPVVATPKTLPKAALNDTLGRVRERGSINLGVRESSGALSYALGEGRYTGFHVEICERVVQDLQRQLGLAHLGVYYIPVTSQNRIPLLQNGTIDLECGSTTNNASRQKDVAFGLTTYVEEVRVAVRTQAGIKNLKQLEGRSVVTTQNTTSAQHLQNLMKTQSKPMRLSWGKDHADSFLMLESGRAEAFVMDRAILTSLVARARQPQEFMLLDEVLAVEPIAIMLRKDDEAMKKRVDDTIRSLMKSGDMEKLWDKWFVQPIPLPLVAVPNARVGLPLSTATRKVWANPNDRPAEDYSR
jgi:glutamate/aspartate transport system substrate-binding protein